MATPDTTFWQAVGALSPLVGGGGITAIVLAWLGYKKSVSSGGKQTFPQESTLAIGALYADREILERAALGLEGLSHAIKSLNECINGDGMDELRKLRRALEDDTEARRHRK